tara:strand:+ start:717 stop:3077 length:2361 start_codon:yes stop_codon:yes gene_type:complete
MMKKSLAHRKMFRNGGYVNSGPAGIMASSPSLIDAVTRDAMHPQGGHTLSMAGGGIVRKMASGGSLSNPSAYLYGAVNPVVRPQMPSFGSGQPLLPSEVMNNYDWPESAQAILPSYVVGGPKKTTRAPGTPASGSPAVSDTVTIDELVEEYVTGDTDFVVRDYLKSISGTPAYGRIYSTLQDAAASVEETGSIDYKKPALGHIDFERQDIDVEMGDDDLLEGGIPPTQAEKKQADIEKVSEIGEEIEAPGGGAAEKGPVMGDAGEIDPASQEEIIVKSSTDSNKPAVITDRPTLFNALKKKGTGIDPDAKNAAIDDVIGRLADGALSGKIDIATIKKDIEALLPAVEDDSQMEGLLLAQLGAAIASGKDPSALTNIGAGLEKALPKIMDYKNKQTAAKRQRQMSIAKIALTQKFALESEQRAEDRAIRKGTRAEETAIRKEKRVAEAKRLIPGDYAVIEATTIPANLLKEGAKGNITVPAGTYLQLDQYGKDRMSQLGIPIVSQDRIKYDWDDIKSGGKDKKLTAKELSYMGKNVTGSYAPFKKWGIDYKPNYFRPTLAGMTTKINGKPVMAQSTIEPNELRAMHGAYEQAAGPVKKLYQDVQGLKKYIGKPGEKSKLTGWGGVKQRIGDTLAAVSVVQGGPIDQFSKALLDNQGASQVSQFEAEARIILARLAPMILQESGKTISDADRIRVAQILGFEVAIGKAEDGSQVFNGVTGFDNKFIRNPETIRNAIQATSNALARSYNEVHDAYSTELNRFGIVPKLREQYGPGKRAQKTTFDIDLTV